MKLTARTISAITNPGGIQTQGIFWSVDGARGVDHLAEARTGGRTPRPRNLSDASRRIASATPNVATTVNGPRTFGSRWRSAMLVAPVPTTRGGDEFRLAQGQQLAPDEARRRRPAQEPDDGDDGREARPDDRDEDDARAGQRDAASRP